MPSMAPFHLLGQDHLEEMQHDFFVQVMSLALAPASCDANDIINDNTAFV